MKQLKITLFAILLFLSTVANASRIPEVEQYYIDKVSSLLKTRFPDTPFTVFVQVDVGDRSKEGSRKKEIRRGDTTTVQLPYLEVEDDDDVSIWNRTDVPLGTLIGLLERVVLRVQIDSSVDDKELKDLQDNLAKQLKLDAKADTIEIARVPFNQAEKQKQKLWWVLGMFIMIAAVSTIFYFLAKHSVKALVKGLAQPISEIGKSTQEFANSALNMAADLSQPSSVSDKAASGSSSGEDELSLGSNLIEIRKSALELITRNQNMFKNPDSRFLSFLEQQGTDNPTQMGAILAELDQESIKTLYKYGWGTWWFTALASPAPLTPVSIRILSEIDRLRLRWHFNDDENSEYKKSNQEAGLVFGRLTDEELVTLLKDVQLGDAEPIFDLLPRSQALSVAKKLYPGQWAKLLEHNSSGATVLHVLNAGLVEKLTKRALELKPLRKEVQIQNFFADLDLVKYLDVATPRDEKDFYMVLPKESKIKAERFPFYQVFEASNEVKKMMGGDINAKDWAYVLSGCEQSDQRSMLEAFSDRLRFMIQEYMSDLDKSKVDNQKVRNIRKAIIQSYFRHSENIKFKSKDTKDETTRTKAA